MAKIYYRMQMKEGSDGATITDIVLSQNRITSNIEYAGDRFLNLKSGSIILVHKGSIPIALVKIVNKIPDDQIKQPSFGIDYNIKIISYYNKVINEFPELNELYQNIPFQGTFAQIENGNPTYKRISKWFHLISKKEIMQQNISLLKYKRQIILQGPPGTGKTRLAKLIAEEMTKAVEVKNPMELIDDFFLKFDSTDKLAIERRAKYFALLNDFQSKFQIQSIENISKENYCIGTGSNDSFCWWIERGLISLGYYFPGSARSYLIYWKKSINGYSKHGIAAQIENDDEAMKRIAKLISDLLVDQNVPIATTFLGNSFILKILHSYYPEKYFPVNSIPCLDNILKLFGENYSSLSAIDKNLKVQQLFSEKKKALGSDVSNIEFMKFLFENFDLKGNIEITTNQIISKGKYKVIQFHPSFTYEDFVRGISAKTNSDSKVFYKVEDRILMEFAQEAMDNAQSNFVLILDEINRANLSSVLGELIYALEYRYDHKKNNFDDASVESLYDISEDDEEPKRTLLLPENLYIIGTMNTADRSVGHIDYAIRRRFAFIDVPPSSNALDEVISDPILNSSAKALYEKVANLFHEDKNDGKEVFLQSDFKAKDVQLGHSYFLVESEQQLKLKLKYEIKPLLNEYVKDGILSDSALDVIKNL